MDHEITQIAEEESRGRDLTGFWEVLRTVSGVIAALALAAIVASTVVRTEPRQSTSVITAPPAAPADGPERPAIVVSGPPVHALHVFYLVQTPEQESFAHWGENGGATDLSRSGPAYGYLRYDVLYTRTEEEQRIAAQTILETMLDYRHPVIVDVIDLRPIENTRLR